jgi:hypothetical protein
MVRWIEAQSPPVRWLGALSDEARFKEARALLPSCYSNEFDLCVTKKNVNGFPNCARLNELWGDNKADPVYQQLHDEVAKMPYCSPAPAESAESPNYVGYALAVGVGLLVGFSVAAAL